SASAVTFHAGAAALAETRGGARATLRGVSGSVGAHARAIAWFELAGERHDDVEVLVASANAGVTGDTSTGAEGVIGSICMGLLRSFVSTLDYRTARAVFTRRRRAPLRVPAR